jgi:hypothetical protein
MRTSDRRFTSRTVMSSMLTSSLRPRTFPSRRFAFGVTVCTGLLASKPAEAQDAGAVEVCQRWTADRADVSEGASTADVPTCSAGTWGAPGPANSLKLVNLYRFFAAMPAVTEDPSYDAFAQSCALLQAANSAAGLSHAPDAAAACYSAMGATGSAHSSICGGEGVACIDLYMSDEGSAELGHRRWVLANYLGPVGFGSVGTGGRTATGSCFYQPAGTLNAHMPFVAWPPPGNVPLQAIATTSTDAAGWSIQSDTINLNTATVTVTDAATNRPVTVTALPANFGSTYAIKVLPNGWTSQGGHAYAVSVAGISSPISYTVDVVDCTTIDAGEVPAGDAGGSPGGPGAADAGGSGAARDASSVPASDAGGAAGGPGPRDGDPGDATVAGDDRTASDASPGTTPTSGGEGGDPFGAVTTSSGCSCQTARAPWGAGYAWMAAALLVLRRVRPGRGSRRRSRVDRA